MTTHTYEAHLAWDGSTAGGVRSYPRQHTVHAPPARTSLTLSADAVFRGDPELLNPEQLLVAAASSCQLLSFLAAAARRGIDIVGYEDRAVGTMDAAASPAHVSSFRLRPTIRTSADPLEVVRLVEEGHRRCYVANSLVADVVVEPTVVAP